MEKETDRIFRGGWNAALDAIAASMTETLKQSQTAEMPDEHKGGINSALVWAIAEAHRLVKE